MLLGVIADDFTGASDIANTLARGGLRTAQFVGIPRQSARQDVEAGVVSLKTRSVVASEAVRQSLDALRWLLAQGCRQIVFKYCSTFDSTPDGNIGPVAEALAGALDVAGVVACPAFPSAGRTVYQGHLFVHDRLLNEFGLEKHPLNPMSDADIRRWLRHQTTHPVGHIGWPSVRGGPEQIAGELGVAAKRGECIVIVDALSDEDLVAIGRASADAKLITGGSGIALGLPANFIAAGLAQGTMPEQSGVEGPAAILAGSCSGATRDQIEHHRQSHATLAIDVELVMSGQTTADDIASFLLTTEDKAPLAYSSQSPDSVKLLQERHGRGRVAETLDALFAATAAKLVRSGVRRIVVAGGETSGAVVSGLNLDVLKVGSEIDPGVPVLTSEGPVPVALALKSGNFGARDFFTKALDRMAAR